MAKVLGLRDYLLLTAALASDVFDEVRFLGGLVPGIFESRYGFVPSQYKRSSCSSAVSRMLTSGEIIRKINKKGDVYLELTSRGVMKLKRKFRFIANNHKWDGSFMIASFDIAEENRKERDNLRIKLREFGFGMLQESVWISPYHFEEDLREYLVENRLEDKVFVLSANKILAGNIKEMAARIWGLDRLNDRYQLLITKCKEVALIADKAAMTNEAMKLLEGYFEILASDPMLPEQLLVGDWSRSKAKSSIDALLNR